MINRRKFGRLLAERYGITYQAADRFCKDAFELLGTLLYKENEDVVIYGFGAFKHKTAKAKRFKHPTTGEMCTIKERDFVKFTPSELFDIKEEEQ